MERWLGGSESDRESTLEGVRSSSRWVPREAVGPLTLVVPSGIVCPPRVAYRALGVVPAAFGRGA